MADTPPARLLRSLLVVCACLLVVLVVACLALARVVLIPLVLAVLLSFILTPLVVRLQRLGLGRLPSVLLVSTLALAVVGGLGAVILLQFRSLVNDLPRYRENITRKAAGLRNVGPGNLVENIQNAIDDIHDKLTRQPEGPGTKAEPLPVRLQPSGRARFEALASLAVSFLGHFALVAILVVFMLACHEDVRDRLIGLVGHGRLTGTTKALEEAGRRVSRFLIMQVVINTGFGLALGLGLFLIGLPQALLWGLLVGALRFVPYLGSSVGALMLVALSVIIFPGWGAPLAVVAVFLALEGVTANVIEPLLFGHSTGVSPLALLFAAAFWAWLRIPSVERRGRVGAGRQRRRDAPPDGAGRVADALTGGLPEPAACAARGAGPSLALPTVPACSGGGGYRRLCCPALAVVHGGGGQLVIS